MVKGLGVVTYRDLEFMVKGLGGAVSRPTFLTPQPDVLGCFPWQETGHNFKVEVAVNGNEAKHTRDTLAGLEAAVAHGSGGGDVQLDATRSSLRTFWDIWAGMRCWATNSRLWLAYAWPRQSRRGV